MVKSTSCSSWGLWFSPQHPRVAKDHLSLQFYGSCCPPLAFLGIAHTWCQHFHKHTFHTRSCIFSISSPASHSQNHDYKAPSCLDSTWQSSPVASLLSKVCCLISFTEANGIKIFACNLLIIAHLFFFFLNPHSSLWIYLQNWHLCSYNPGAGCHWTMLTIYLVTIISYLPLSDSRSGALRCFFYFSYRLPCFLGWIYHQVSLILFSNVLTSTFCLWYALS